MRGSVVCPAVGGLRAVLRAPLELQAEGSIAIVSVKNRFARPTGAGWADAMLNLCLLYTSPSPRD